MTARPGAVWACFALATVAPFLAVLPAAGGENTAPPSVRLEATLRPSDHTISGWMVLTLAEGDPRASGPLWLHLPPNRFLEPDPRGERRHLALPPFAFSYLEPELRDPWLPDGFSHGEIVIQSVETLAGVSLPYTFEDNLAIPVGYSIRRGVLRVNMPADGKTRAVLVRFETRLPHRMVDGWSETAWVLSRWFPEPVRYEDGRWDFSVFRHTPMRITARIAATEPGWLATGRGEAQWLEPGAAMETGPDPLPEKDLSLVFVPTAERLDSTLGDSAIVSLYQPQGRRIAGLSLRVARVFLGHVQARFGLPLPRPGVVIVQADLPPEEMLILGQVLVISKDFARQTPLMDRSFVGQVAQALGQVWFGEGMWCDEDSQAWLRYGFAGYLALDFFQALYGWDARVHTLTDWLNPRFREHYFEAPALALLRDGEDGPLLLSLTGHPRRRTALVVVHRKAPLVLRSLSFVTGEDAFAAAIGAFFRTFNRREAGATQWRSALERVAGLDLAWFFQEWFQGTPRLDYAIADWNQEPQDGGTRVTMRLVRSGDGRMPVVVRVTAEDGAVFMHRTDGIANEEVLVFQLATPAAAVDLDPGEYLLEENRRNNHSTALYRVRPFFDWSKQREILISLRGRAGGNAVDGNYAGVGVNVQLDADNQVRFIPVYGERTGWVNYEMRWRREHFLAPRLSLDLAAERFGGLRNRSVRLGYRHDASDGFYLETTLAARGEEVESVHHSDKGRVRSQPAGDTNNVELTHTATALWNSRWSSRFALAAEHAQSSYVSDFDYTLVRADFGQTWTITPWHQVQLELIRQSSAGRAPLQKQPLLGDPLVLRGYPRSFRLVHEQLAAARVEYRWTLSRTVHGREIQVRRVQLIAFHDAGKGWDNDQAPDTTPQRQNAGFGMELDVNVVGLAEFPARLEVAVPYNDPQFKTTKVIFFQALSFF